MTSMKLGEWQPPLLRNTSISNCTAAFEWAEAKSSNGAVNLKVLSRFLLSMLPADATSRLTVGDLVNWYETLPDRELLHKAVHDCDLRNPCNENNYISLDGDTDVLGMGMIISYYLAIFSASAYFFILLAEKFGLLKKSHRVVQSAHKTTNTFFDAALIFAVSMLAAGVVRMASVLLDKPDEDGLPAGRAAINATYMAIFSVFPPLLLSNMVRTTHPHKTLRYVLWVALSALTSATDVLIIVIFWGGGASGATKEGVDDGRDNLWAPCRLRRPVIVVFLVAHVVLWVNFIWQLALMISAMLPEKYRLIKETKTGPETEIEREKMKKKSPRELLANWRFDLKIANGLLCFATGWVLLAVYHAHVRMERGWVPNENTWDFGQVLALATWAPVVVDFLTRYVYPEGTNQWELMK
ncbi:c6 zinc finger domain containing protein [Apiospora arundinis]|uniref:C6 zinc finger domain containing protein n=1 Tax=Apiospora arundinis TaxID=335852 RepID=A0ABR2HY93_9PEZI